MRHEGAASRVCVRGRGWEPEGRRRKRKRTRVSTVTHCQSVSQSDIISHLWSVWELGGGGEWIALTDQPAGRLPGCLPDRSNNEGKFCHLRCVDLMTDVAPSPPRPQPVSCVVNRRRFRRDFGSPLLFLLCELTVNGE